MGMSKKELINRIKRLEKEVSELSGITNAVKETLDRLVRDEKMSLPLSRSVMGVTTTTDANPWAIEATKSVIKTRKMRDWISSARINTYRQTLTALKSEQKWLSAEEVGEKTGRKRNTESTYLNRLFRAGLIEQRMQGNKALYTIKDHKNIVRLFGEL